MNAAPPNFPSAIQRLLVSQTVIPGLGKLGGAVPMAFTEQGVAMLSSVLRGERAVQVNIAIFPSKIQNPSLYPSNFAAPICRFSLLFSLGVPFTMRLSRSPLPLICDRSHITCKSCRQEDKTVLLRK